MRLLQVQISYIYYDAKRSKSDSIPYMLSQERELTKMLVNLLLEDTFDDALNLREARLRRVRPLLDEHLDELHVGLIWYVGQNLPPSAPGNQSVNVFREDKIRRH